MNSYRIPFCIAYRNYCMCPSSQSFLLNPVDQFLGDIQCNSGLYAYSFQNFTNDCLINIYCSSQCIHSICSLCFCILSFYILCLCFCARNFYFCFLHLVRTRFTLCILCISCKNKEIIRKTVQKFPAPCICSEFNTHLSQTTFCSSGHCSGNIDFRCQTAVSF